MVPSASQQGVPRAQYQLGLMYDKAQGVPQDYVTAYALPTSLSRGRRARSASHGLEYATPLLQS
jgi:TPR repeat protein